MGFPKVCLWVLDPQNKIKYIYFSLAVFPATVYQCEGFQGIYFEEPLCRIRRPRHEKQLQRLLKEKHPRVPDFKLHVWTQMQSPA